MNGHHKHRSVDLFYTQIQRGYYNYYIVLCVSCIQDMNRHDKQRSVEFYIIEILKKNDQFFISLEP